MMSESPLDPFSVPTEWHRYLYCNILLPWEMTLKNCNGYPRYSRNKPIAGVRIVKVSNTSEVERVWAQVGTQSKVQSSFTLATEGQALKELAGMLRNCAAHGHYTRVGISRIRFEHRYKGKIKMFGELKFSELRALVSVIAGG